MSSLQRSLAQVVKGLGWMLIGVELLALMGHTGHLFWLGDLAAHFRLQYVFVGSAFLAVAAIGRSWRWAEQLQPLLARFPHHRVLAREGNFGMALLSRFPGTPISVQTFGEAGIPSLQTAVNLPDGSTVNILGAHPLPPFQPRYKLIRDEQLELMAAHIAGIGGYWVVAGDLNVTMYSPVHGIFAENAGLVSVRRGHGLCGTWPSYASVVGIPIDHIHVSPSIGVRSVTVESSIGSDHLPLSAVVVIPKNFP